MQVAEEISHEIIDEARHDWVSFPFISQCVRVYEGSEQGEQSLSRRAVEIAATLVGDGRIMAGDLTHDGFTPWGGDSRAVVERLCKEAAATIDEYGYLPLAEVCWFATPELLVRQGMKPSRAVSEEA